MILHDYPVKRRTAEQLEADAIYYRKTWGLGPEGKIDVFALLFSDVPEALKKRGLSLVERSAGIMADKEAYANPKSKRIFYRARLLAQLRLGHPKAALIFIHELAHLLLHPGGDKPWVTAGNDIKIFIADEESAEWQATVFTLFFLAPGRSAASCKSPEEIALKFGLDLQYSAIRSEMLNRRKKREVPKIYYEVKAELVEASKTSYLTDLCSMCGRPKLQKLDGKYRCCGCGTLGSKFQDGDLGEFEL